MRFELGDPEYLPCEDARSTSSRRTSASSSAPDHANVAAELARVVRPGGRVGFTAWKPNPKLGDLYRRFTEVPIEGREVYEWGREDHVEDMLGEDFELEFEDGTLWLEADDGEELWEVFSQSAPPGDLAARAARARRTPRSSTGRSSSSTRATARRGRHSRAAPLSARARPAQVSDVAALLQELIRLDTTNPPGNETQAAELLRAYLEPAGIECELYAREPGAREPRGAPPRYRRRAVAGAALAHRRRARRSLRVAARAVLRRPRRRRGVGPRRARHEGRGRRERGRAGRHWRAKGGAAGATWSSWRSPTRRSATASGSSWLCEEHPEAVRVRLLGQRGRRRPRRARRPGVVPLFGRREDDVAVRASRPRAQRARVDAGHRRQRARQGGRATSSGSARFSPEPRLIPETEGFLARRSRRRARRGRSARGRAGGRSACRRAPGAAACRDRRTDDGARIRQAQRHSRALHGRDRLPPAPRPDAGRGRARDPRPARAGRLRPGRQRAGARRHTLRGRRPAVGRRRLVHRRRGAGAKGSPRCAWRASPTRTGSARRSAPFAYGFFPARTMDPEVAARLVHSADERVPISDLELGVRWLQHAARTVCG